MARWKIPALVFCSALVLGCVAANGEYGQGNGEVDLAMSEGDLPILNDGPNLACKDIQGRVEESLKANTACKVDGDCTYAQTACGLPAACGDAYVNKGWRTDAVVQLLSSWVANSCGPKECPCPKILLPEPACNAGVCGPKMTPQLGAIGAPCTANSQCLSNQCLTQAEDKTFVDGYCTIKGCGGTGAACPAGSDCRGLSNGTRICVNTCKVVDRSCRKGYACCTGPGPGRPEGWCSPDRSALCIAL